MLVNSTEYSRERFLFFKKHKNVFECETSPMDEYGVYHKEYVFKDGSVWYERMSPEYVKQEVEVKIKLVKVKVEVEIKMFCTEYWNTDNSESKKYYEQF